MSEPTRPSRDAASLIFNLPDYRVIDAIDLLDGRRRIEVESLEPAGCPACGVVAVRVHSRRRQRVRDVPIGGPVEVVWCKRRWFCDEVRCDRGTFAEFTEQVPRRARSTARLRAALLAAVVESGRAASEAARAHGVSWWLVQTAVTAAVVLLPDVDSRLVRRLGIDEHRYRSVRFFREPSGTWRRFEPWMSTIVDIDTGQVLASSTAPTPPRSTSGLPCEASSGGTPFRSSQSTRRPRSARPCASSCPVPPSASTHSHLVKLSNDMLTTVRQRLAREQKQRRGRLIDPSWANRRLLLRGADTLTERAWARLWAVFAADDPTDELGAAWGVKEHLRMLLRSGSLAEAHDAKMRLGLAVIAADMPETTRLFDTITAWWDAIEVLITGATNARTEAANTSIKHIKRTGRGFRNEANYRARILLRSAARTAA